MAIESRRLVASIVVIGLLSVMLSLGCSEGIHLPLLGTLDGKCARTAHADVTPATVGSESSRTLVSQLVVLGLGFAVSTRPALPAALVAIVGAMPNPPPDPLNGRLRI